MSHRHFCEFAGHYWDCSGDAVRLFESEPSVCMCIQHRVPMDEGDHSSCPVELLSCSEHRADQMRAMGYDADYTVTVQSEQAAPTFRDAHGNPIVGFCIWCGRDFYTYEEHDAHAWGDTIQCPVFSEYRKKHPAPLGSLEIFEDEDLIDREEQE